MSFYPRMQAVALRLIEQYGQPVIIRKTEVGEWDPDQSDKPPEITTEQTAQGILIDFTGQEFQNNSLIKQGDKKLKIAAKGLEWVPGLLNKVIVQGRTWSIVPPLKGVNPAGTPILYELQVRS